MGPARRNTRNSLGVVAVVAVRSFTGSEPHGSTTQDVRIQVDIYSGRPNPSWSASESETRTLAGLVAGLTEVAAFAERPPGLGFRGFIVTDLPLAVDQDVASFEVRPDHLVGFVGDGSPQYYEDERGTVFDTLLEMSRTRVSTETLAAMTAG